MPKIIPGLREKLLAAARKRLAEDRDFSTRQLAADCGVAAGTVYNYFSTKEELLACVMLADWQTCLSGMDADAEEAATEAEGLLRMEARLRTFSEPYRPVWQGYDRSAPVREHHGRLIGQIRRPLERLLGRFGRTCGETELLVLSEMLLAASQREAETIGRLIPVMEKILA